MGKKIKELRLERGLSQYALGEAIGVRWLTIGRWENNVQRPHKRHLTSLAKFFGVKEHDLMSPNDSDNNEETMMKIVHSP